MSLTPEQTRQDLLAAASRVLDSRARLFESLNLDNSGIWGLSARDLGIGDTPGWELVGGPGAGLTYLDRQKRGEYIPAFLNASQLRLFRQRIRQLCLSNPIALNVVSAHQSYGIGEGFRYEASASKLADRSGGEHPGIEKLVERVQRVIDAFTEHNELALREAEISSRVDIDGEAILRLFPRESGLLSVRTVEPEHVWFPGGDSGDDSFGVRTAPGDVETPVGYWVVTGIPDEGAQPELIDASEIWHLKSQETPRTSKRGFSDFFAVHTELVASSELLKAVVAMAKARSKIAWVEQMEGATVDVAMALANSQAAATATDPMTGQTVNMERYPAGSVLRTNNEIVFPAGNVSAADYLEVLNADLRIIAARFSMPEYMLSSDASNANYSSTLVAESPFVKKMQRRQSYFGKALGSNRHAGPTRSLVWRQVAHCVEIGMLPPEVFRLVDIQVTGPTLTVRDVAKEAQVDQILHGMGAKSITTIQLQQSLDPDEEGANIAKEKKAAALNADPAILPSVPGMNGQEQMTPPQEGQAEPSPLGESVGPHRYGCLMAIIPADVGDQITGWARKHIDAKHLGSEGLEADPHITVKYGFRDSGPKTVARVKAMLADVEPFTIRLGDFSSFDGKRDEGDPLFVQVESKDLDSLNARVSKAFPCKDSHPTYTPHLTVAYIDGRFIDSYAPIEGLPFQGVDVEIRAMEWSGADGSKEVIPLKANAPARESYAALLDDDRAGETYTLAEWESLREAGEKRQKGEVWQGASGRWFTVGDKGRTVPAKNPSAAPKPEKKATPAKAKAEPKAKKKAPAPDDIPPAPKTAPVEGLEGVDMHAAEHAVADAIKAAHGTTDLTTLRKQMKDRLPGNLFDRAMLQMHDDKVIHLNADGTADSNHIDADDSGAVRDGKTLFTTTTLRDGPKTPKGAAKKDAPRTSPTKTAPKAKEAPAPSPVHAQIADALAKADPKTLAAIAKLLGIGTEPARPKPAPKVKVVTPAPAHIEKGVADLVDLAGKRSSTREELHAGLEKLDLGKLSKSDAVAAAKKLGRKAATKAQAIDQIRRVVLERKEQLHSADS